MNTAEYALKLKNEIISILLTKKLTLDGIVLIDFIQLMKLENCKVQLILNILLHVKVLKNYGNILIKMIS